MPGLLVCGAGTGAGGLRNGLACGSCAPAGAGGGGGVMNGSSGGSWCSSCEDVDERGDFGGAAGNRPISLAMACPVWARVPSWPGNVRVWLDLERFAFANAAASAARCRWRSFSDAPDEGRGVDGLEGSGFVMRN
ncbi:hypothetical protein LTR28_008376, partial [Elasticomyces elasticus]